MTGLAAIVVGVLIGLGGWLLLRRGGEAWRIGRLLAVAPQRTLAEAVALATRGEPAYVRIHGRIDSDEQFPGDDGAALVFRRRRLQREGRGLISGKTWRTFDDARLAVPFRLADRGERVAIDVDALGDGLVVVPGLSTGVAADLKAADLASTIMASANAPSAGLAPADVAPDLPVRLRIEQVATTDHGTAAGVPRRSPEGDTILGPGLGRPLILTTLDLDEAMRVLGAERRRPLLIAGAMLIVAALLVTSGVLFAVLGW